MRITWKIGKKKRGNWRTPFDFHVEIDDDADVLALRPLLRLEKTYRFPSLIFYSKESKTEKSGTSCCRRNESISVDIDRYIDQQGVLFDKLPICGSDCNGCRGYLDWRPGKPDYSDFEAVFQQIAEDLLQAWQQAINEAMDSEEYESHEVIITSETLTRREVEKELANRPTRKLVV